MEFAGRQLLDIQTWSCMFFEFDGLVLDLRQGRLLRGGADVELRPKSLALLIYLIENAGRILSKDELVSAVWPTVTVSDESLAQCIMDIRRALGPGAYGLIRTLPRRGYLVDEDRVHATEDAKTRRSDPAMPAKASIVVLPFANLDGNSKQGIFTDGLTEDLITDLSRYAGLLVIARQSSLAYKGKTTDVRVIARDLGVRFVLEGSARRAGGRIRINAQLVDAIAGDLLWADRFDRNIEDVFAVQDEVAGKIVEALIGKLRTPLPVRNRPANLDAYELCVKARALIASMGGSPEAVRESILLLKQAISLDPGYAEAIRWLGFNLWSLWSNAIDSADSNLAEAISLAERAVSLDPNDGSNHWIFGYLLASAGRWADSEKEFAATFELDPNHADAMVMRAELTVMAGRPKEAAELITKAFRLNPHPSGWYYWELGLVQYAAQDYEAAVKTLRTEATYRTGSRRILAASLAQLGRHDEAIREAQVFLANNPGFTITQWASRQPVRDAGVLDHFADGYRKAGLPH
ncbi:winged helix-turn-helix domain-containing protein [Mesorhizobium sp. WSM4887]|uniref:winged helix-turn-helix domain-containing tetratricopeptide repeat protein n=1 Tax=Mesorhizobium sp. WSM4887 TaxID=3038543 RepID=UPI0024180013|nr:winged helix-turn-helix domain-containing protein [Mesorhizobium sp. WSM4887]MDG4885753.1 winged helix-turn-helix domain-containing protein [Mesorhizobium sp. WSM4887]